MQKSVVKFMHEATTVGPLAELETTRDFISYVSLESTACHSLGTLGLFKGSKAVAGS